MGLLGKPTILGNPPYINQKLTEAPPIIFHVLNSLYKKPWPTMFLDGLPTLVGDHAQVYVLHPGNLT